MTAERQSGERVEDSVPPPTGTIFVLGLYMVVLAVAWCVMFWLLTER